jgi:hypothetical protein
MGELSVLRCLSMRSLCLHAARMNVVLSQRNDANVKIARELPHTTALLWHFRCTVALRVEE